MENVTNETILNLQKLVQMAQDVDFFDLCMNDPGRAFRKASGADLPIGQTLRCLAAQPGELIICLPNRLESAAEKELADDELDRVAAAGFFDDIANGFSNGNVFWTSNWAPTVNALECTVGVSDNLGGHKVPFWVYLTPIGPK